MSWNPRDVTFIVPHYMRPDDLMGCVKSIEKYYPQSKILTKDTRGNVSWGRNRLLKKVRTHYSFLIEEDMRVGPNVNLQSLVRIMEHSNVVGVGFGLLELQKKRVLAVAADFTKTGKGRLDLRDATVASKTEMGDTYIACDYIANAWLGITSEIRKCRWNESLALGEHEMWFHDQWLISQHRFALSSQLIEHRHSRPTLQYKKHRMLRYHRGLRKARQMGFSVDMQRTREVWDKCRS